MAGQVVFIGAMCIDGAFSDRIGAAAANALPFVPGIVSWLTSAAAWGGGATLGQLLMHVIAGPPACDILARADMRGSAATAGS
jgi:hypothetical protein